MGGDDTGVITTTSQRILCAVLSLASGKMCGESPYHKALDLPYLTLGCTDFDKELWCDVRMLALRFRLSALKAPKLVCWLKKKRGGYLTNVLGGPRIKKAFLSVSKGSFYFLLGSRKRRNFWKGLLPFRLVPAIQFSEPKKRLFGGRKNGFTVHYPPLLVSRGDGRKK